MSFRGIWLPIITPFKDGKVDMISYKRLVENYLDTGITGIMPMGTTGESPTVSDEEYFNLVRETVKIVNGRVKVVVGLGGNNTASVIEKAKKVETMGVDGILSVSPYYSRPDQRGIYSHFKALAEATSLKIVLYNIPYRTGRNMENNTIIELAKIPNIVAIKDASGDFNLTQELLMNKPEGFEVLTGEDVLLYSSALLGGDGGILASCHLNTEKFVEIFNLINEQKADEALKIWKELYPIVPLLFKEPNPAPLKFILKEQKLIDSDEIRLPLVNITSELEKEIREKL